MNKDMNLPLKKLKWPDMAPKGSNVPTHVPGYQGHPYRWTLRVAWPVSLDNGFIPVTPPNIIVFFMYLDRKKAW